MSATVPPSHVLQQYLRGRGLRNTPQRQLILAIFLREGGHLTIDEIYAKARAEDPEIGQATVYRTLKLMDEAGLARSVRFEDGMVRYETGKPHHDHLICERCSRTIEVVDPEIERLQKALAARYDFLPTSHSMVLFGVCADCRRKAGQAR